MLCIQKSLRALRILNCANAESSLNFYKINILGDGFKETKFRQRTRHAKFIAHQESEVGIHKKKQENTLSTKKVIKKKKFSMVFLVEGVFSFFFFFIVFFYTFSPLVISLQLQDVKEKLCFSQSTKTVKKKGKKTRFPPRKRPRKKENLSFFLDRFLGQGRVFFFQGGAEKGEDTFFTSEIKESLR